MIHPRRKRTNNLCSLGTKRPDHRYVQCALDSFRIYLLDAKPGRLCISSRTKINIHFFFLQEKSFDEKYVSNYEL